MKDRTCSLCKGKDEGEEADWQFDEGKWTHEDCAERAVNEYVMGYADFAQWQIERQNETESEYREKGF